MATIIDPIIPAAADAGTAEHVPIIAGAITAALTATVGVAQVAGWLEDTAAGAVNIALTAWVGVATAWITMRVTARRRV